MDIAALPILFIGPHNSGKTALIHSALNNQQEIFPTAGIEINYITSTSKTILAYDCSGEGSARSNWSLLAGTVEGVVYVIDSYRKQTFVWAKKHLYTFLQQHKSMRQKPLCIMLNKCDLKNRPGKQLMVRALQMQRLNKLVGKSYVKQTSAFSKQGIDECLEWLIKNCLSGGEQKQ